MHKKELLRQHIKSLVEQGGYADIVPREEPWWKRRWVVGAFGAVLGASAVFVLLG